MREDQLARLAVVRRLGHGLGPTDQLEAVAVRRGKPAESNVLPDVPPMAAQHVERRQRHLVREWAIAVLNGEHLHAEALDAQLPDEAWRDLHKRDSSLHGLVEFALAMELSAEERRERLAQHRARNRQRRTRRRWNATWFGPRVAPRLWIHGSPLRWDYKVDDIPRRRLRLKADGPCVCWLCRHADWFDASGALRPEHIFPRSR